MKRFVTLSSLVLIAVLAFFASPAAVKNTAETKKASAEGKPDLYHVIAVSYEGYENYPDGLITINTAEAGKGVFRKSLGGGKRPPYVFEVDFHAGSVKVRTLGDRYGWKELEFPKANREMFNELRNILAKNGENVGVCRDNVPDCTVFIF